MYKYHLEIFLISSDDPSQSEDVVRIFSPSIYLLSLNLNLSFPILNSFAL